ncbi:glycosyltransferase family protein [Neobacillus dielmonensis]|uniref:hypothetical protein n=1 Tax=Neobacillus dielmonensis TaxID=1347369 RepID=UPI0005A9C0AB|nr:hypothetical protein [Neobacillus dielmonensis]
MILCTIATQNHLARALVLAESIKKYMPQLKVVLCLLEKSLPKEFSNISFFDRVILAKDLFEHSFETKIFKYNAFQLANSLKAKLLLYSLKAFQQEEYFVYLDSDIEMKMSIEEIIHWFKGHDILLTPHLLKQPQNEELEIHVQQTGIFNSGFVAVKRSENTTSFLNWWDERLEEFCYLDLKKGIFYDQKWLNLAPCFYDVFTIRNPGYNIGIWNMADREVVEIGQNLFVYKNEPVRFIHYSGLLGNESQTLSQRLKSTIENYNNKLESYNLNQLKQMDWSYNYFHDGTKISEDTRKNYRQFYDFLKIKLHNPFQYSNQFFNLKNIKQFISGKGAGLKS